MTPLTDADVYMIRQKSNHAYSDRAWRSLAYVRRHLNSTSYSSPCEVVRFRLEPIEEAQLKRGMCLPNATHLRLRNREDGSFIGYLVKNPALERWSSGSGKFTLKGRVWRTLNEVYHNHKNPESCSGCILLQCEMVPFETWPLGSIRYTYLDPIIHYEVRGVAACGAPNVECWTDLIEDVTCPNCSKTKILRGSK